MASTSSQNTSPIKNHIRVMRFNADEMTQQALADLVGITRQTVIALEKGKYNPSLELAFKIAAAFGQPLEKVFEYQPATKEGNSNEK